MDSWLHPRKSQAGHPDAVATPFPPLPVARRDETCRSLRWGRAVSSPKTTALNASQRLYPTRDLLPNGKRGIETADDTGEALRWPMRCSRIHKLGVPRQLVVLMLDGEQLEEDEEE